MPGTKQPTPADLQVSAKDQAHYLTAQHRLGTQLPDIWLPDLSFPFQPKLRAPGLTAGQGTGMMLCKVHCLGRQVCLLQFLDLCVSVKALVQQLPALASAACKCMTSHLKP